MSPVAVRKIEQKRGGILLDISFGGTPQERSVVFGPEGDVPQNPTHLPFPFSNAVVHTAIVTHVLEFIEQDKFFDWFDELWRIMRPLGLVHFSGPYGGDDNHGWLSDPTHKTRVIEQTFTWLDSRMPPYQWHTERGRPQPKPWHTLGVARVPATHGTFSYNCTMQKVDVK